MSNYKFKMQKAKLKIMKDEKIFWDAVLDLVQKAKNEAGDQFRIAASGGSSAGIFDVLRDHDFDFSDTALFQVDERFVPHDHPDSNFKLLDEKVGDFVSRFYAFPICSTPEESAEKYAEVLRADKDGFLFDLTILGIGPDGHTASLFPGDPVLDKNEKLTVHTQTEAFAIRDRLTLTFPAIGRSRKILVLMMGAEKRDIFEKITHPEVDFHLFPGRKILDFDQGEILFLDV